MSDFNRTIPVKSLQGGTGTVGTTKGGLVGATDHPVYKGITIKCTHATETLYVLDTRVSAVNGYALRDAEEVTLEIEDIAAIQVVGSAADVNYTWIAH